MPVSGLYYFRGFAVGVHPSLKVAVVNVKLKKTNQPVSSPTKLLKKLICSPMKKTTSLKLDNLLRSDQPDVGWLFMARH